MGKKVVRSSTGAVGKPHLGVNLGVFSGFLLEFPKGCNQCVHGNRAYLVFK